MQATREKLGEDQVAEAQFVLNFSSRAMRARVFSAGALCAQGGFRYAAGVVI